MGNTTSEPDPDPPANPGEGDGKKENPEGKTEEGSKPEEKKSATVVVVSGTPSRAELIYHADVVDSLVTVNGQPQMRSDSDGSVSTGHNIPKWGFSFGGGGGGGGPLPDQVSPEFKLEAIGGLDEEISYLKRSVILPWIRPDVFREWGQKPPKGILLHGPPGTGKTFLAKALVNELRKQTGKRVNFFYRKGGDVFSMWFGESQRQLREVFETAKKYSPSIIFFDEFDGLCPSRDRQTFGTEAYASVVTCFLGQMDTLENGKVFVIAATNRLDSIDPAVRRPGRFDKHIAFGFPDLEGRHRILQVHTNKWAQDDRPEDGLVRRLAEKTLGFSGADLEKLCKDAVYCATEENGGVITPDMKVLEKHWMKALGGMQRTTANSFGSYLMFPTRPSDTVSMLIRPTVDAVIDQIRPLITTITDSTTITKSFLLTQDVAQSKSFTSHQILHGILSNPLFNKRSVFDLSMATISNKVMQGKTFLGVVNDVVNQTMSAENPCVISIPNLNELMAVADENGTGKLLLSTLKKVTGQNVFLIGTSSEPLSALRENTLLELFRGIRRHHAIQNPKKAELVRFYSRIFEDSTIAKQETKKVVETAAKISNAHNYEDVLGLYSAIYELNANSAQMQHAARLKEFHRILDNYERKHQN